jgi:hypothetical protein
MTRLKAKSDSGKGLRTARSPGHDLSSQLDHTCRSHQIIVDLFFPSNDRSNDFGICVPRDEVHKAFQTDK